MTRREQLENIIIGTLLESNGMRNFFDDCRSLSADMFQNETNIRIFGYVREMNLKGKVCTDPCSIFEEYGEAVVDIVADMCGICTDCSFIHLKTEYNEKHYLASCVFGVEYKRTDVQFVDYVTQFIKVVYDEADKARDSRAKNAAA